MSGGASPGPSMEPPAPPDWSELPADVLGQVLRVLEFPDLFSSSAACRSWRAAARDLRRLGLYSRPQTPCLLYAAGAGARAAELYSLAGKATYTVPLPDPPIGDRRVIGSSHGWLVTADARSELHLLNPATGDQLALPPVATVEQVRPLSDAAGSLQYLYYNGNPQSEAPAASAAFAPASFAENFYLKAVLSADPSRGDYAVMLIHHPDYQLSFARSGDKHWNWVKFKNNVRFADCIYHDGVFHAMTFHGAVHIIDVSGDSFTQRLIIKNPMAKIWNVYIVRTPEGEILQVWRITDDQGHVPRLLRTVDFDVYKVDYEKQGLEPVDSLGDNALVVGTSYSSCLSVKDFPRLLPNHIYFDDDNEYWLLEKDGRRDVGVYDYENGTVTDPVSPVPWPNWPPPVWIAPSFTKMAK
ncbi:hypothetical protein ACP70R_021923 [Stipagrostis hirtigluma subsp. patula]